MKHGLFPLKPPPLPVQPSLDREDSDSLSDDPLSDLPPGYTHETLPEHSIESIAWERHADFPNRQIRDRRTVHESNLRLEVYPGSFATRPFTKSDQRTEAMLAIYRPPPDSPLKQTSRFKVGKKAESGLIEEQGLVEHRTGLLRRLIHVPPCYENVKRKSKEWVKQGPESERYMREQSYIVIKNVCKTLNPNLFLEQKFKLRTLNRLPDSVSGYKDTRLSSLPDCLSDMTWVKTLNVSFNRIKKLPPLPPHLTALEASENVGIDLGILPKSLEILSIRGAKLDNLPLLPDNLRYMDISRNRLRYLPSLPPLLNTLIALSNDLRALPETLPIKLAKMNIRKNPNLTKVPELPYSLVWFDVKQCGVEKLPHTFKSDKMWARVNGGKEMNEDGSYRLNSAPLDPARPVPRTDDPERRGGPGIYPGAGRSPGVYINWRKTVPEDDV